MPQLTKTHKKWLWISLIGIVIYAITLFLPLISPFTRYPLYVIKCGGLPLAGFTFMGARDYYSPKDSGYRITMATDFYFCNTEEARQANFRPAATSIEGKKELEEYLQKRKDETTFSLQKASYTVYYPKNKLTNLTVDELTMYPMRGVNYTTFKLRHNDRIVGKVREGKHPNNDAPCNTNTYTTTTSKCLDIGKDGVGRTIKQLTPQQPGVATWIIFIDDTFVEFSVTDQVKLSDAIELFNALEAVK